MLEFVGKEYRSLVDFVLWAILFGCGFGGVVLGYIINHKFNFAFLFFGALFGLVIVILLGGFIANFLTMVDRIEKIEKKLNENSQNTNKEGEVSQRC